MADEDGEVPPSFICPLSMDVMNEPVFTADGFSYERGMIEEWLVGHNTSPLTNAILSHTNLTPNMLLRKQIMEWRDKQTVSIIADRVVIDNSATGILGKGAWGVVRKGTLRIGGKTVPVAIKTIPDADKSAEEVALMFAPEIKNLKSASFKCLYTAKLYGTTIKDGRLCIVMKLYKHNLTKVISLAPDRKLAPQVALQYSIALFRALSELHSVGIVSRDIKPDNILFDDFGTLVIADFGISFQIQNTVGQLQYANKTEAKGTFNYMCAEMFIRGANIDAKVDVYAGACCIAQMLTGKPPFHEFQMQEIVGEVRYEKKMPPEASSPDIPSNIKAIIHQCMQFDPKSRPTASIALALLEKLVSTPVQAITSGVANITVAPKVIFYL